MIDPRRLRLYVVTSAAFGLDHLSVARAAIEGGATAIQLRAPELDPRMRTAVATEIAHAARASGVLFIVNDDVEAAIVSGADGVHVGQDVDARAVRTAIGPQRALGVSVGDPWQVHAAVDAGADHLGVTVWATATKPEARGIGVEGLRALASVTDLPIVGIGGIDVRNAGDVVGAGAAGVAVISAIAAAPDPVAATRALAEVLSIREGVR